MSRGSLARICGSRTRWLFVEVNFWLLADRLLGCEPEPEPSDPPQPPNLAALHRGEAPQDAARVDS
eukprot:4249602-Heterocapsa_arctica.AAC.1